MEEDMYFYPLICCCECTMVTTDWGWVENPQDDEVYGVCNNCKSKVQLNGLSMFN